jgi:hypothetical protein
MFVDQTNRTDPTCRGLIYRHMHYHPSILFIFRWVRFGQEEEEPSLVQTIVNNLLRRDAGLRPKKENSKEKGFEQSPGGGHCIVSIVVS